MKTYRIELLAFRVCEYLQVGQRHQRLKGVLSNAKSWTLRNPEYAKEIGKEKKQEERERGGGGRERESNIVSLVQVAFHVAQNIEQRMFFSKSFSLSFSYFTFQIHRQLSGIPAGHSVVTVLRQEETG